MCACGDENIEPDNPNNIIVLTNWLFENIRCYVKQVLRDNMKAANS